MPRYNYQDIDDAGQTSHGNGICFPCGPGIQEVVIKTMGRQLNWVPSDELFF